MIDPPPPSDIYGPRAPRVVIEHTLSPDSEEAQRRAERRAAEERAEAKEAAEERARAAREAAEEHARREAPKQLEAARQGDTFHANLDKEGRLWVQTRNSEGNASSQSVIVGHVWDALAAGGIDIQPKESAVVRFRIGGEIELAATVKLRVGFFGGRTLLLPSIQVRWLSLEERVAERVADWHANLKGRTGILNVTYYDSNRTEIHEDKINVYELLAKSGIELQPKGSAVVRFALGADLMEATVELEVGFFGFNHKLKLLSVKKKRGEAPPGAMVPVATRLRTSPSSTV
jgi:hypothetical protein